MTFVKNELRNLKKDLESDGSGFSETLRDEDEVMGGVEERWRQSNREAVLKMTMNFLRRMKQEETADCLQSSKIIFRS